MLVHPQTYSILTILRSLAFLVSHNWLLGILSGYVLLYPRIALLTAVLILSIVLLIVGIERIAIGIFSSYHRNSSSRFSNIGLGALSYCFFLSLIPRGAIVGHGGILKLIFSKIADC